MTEGKLTTANAWTAASTLKTKESRISTDNVENLMKKCKETRKRKSTEKWKGKKN